MVDQTCGFCGGAASLSRGGFAVGRRAPMVKHSGLRLTGESQPMLLWLADGGCFARVCYGGG